jgi:hypothetical protein
MRAALFIGALILLLPGSRAVVAQNATQPIVIPPNATELDGVPDVKVETTQSDTKRSMLDAAESTRNRLTIKVGSDGRLRWSSRDDVAMTMSSAGDYLYLSTAEPGRYVRIRQVNDRLTYVEHVDNGSGSVTFWGELRIVVGK